MGRKNSYDAIRLFAAVLVVFSHSFALTGNSGPHIGIFGEIGVWIFFILSGYLISRSWDQYPRFNVFFAKRLLRIVPGLFVATLATVAVVGVFFTSLPLMSYLTNQETLNYINNIFIYNPSFTLPGAFAANPYPNAVNGSIWTLAYEFTMYLVVALIGIFKLYKKIPPIILWLGLFGVVLFITIFGKQPPSHSLFYLDIAQMSIFALIFFSGIIMHKYGERIKLDYRLGILSIALFIGLVLVLPKAAPLFAATLLAYGLFSLGKSPVLSWTSRFGDFSYGLYIYAFPVQQMIASITQTDSVVKMFVASLIVTFVIAVLSWHLVESQALKLKDKINTKKYPLLQSDEAW